MEIETPYLLFIGDAKDALAAKTGQGIADWRPTWSLGQLRFENCRADLHIPDMTAREAVTAGAKTFVIGTVSPGGTLPESWIPVLVSALEAGLDIASGMHTRLSDFPAVAAAAEKHGRRLYDVRHCDVQFGTGNGTARAGNRLLTVGTDCSVGKKYAALAIEKEMRKRGMNADFRATGQTGILIAGGGIAIDAVVADFIAGACEYLTPANSDDHWDIVEGQGSLFHPSFAGVSLGLLHGTQPDTFVVCHEPTRTTMRNVDTPIASVVDVIEQTTALGRLTNPAIRCVGIAVNTANFNSNQSDAHIEELSRKFGLPVTDPMRHGVASIVDELTC
ncbi:MAG: DUF1611 domain-containing protein [Gammaproteobacteria bacterium]|nr:DUF1611 domain-containing protein [Gammaproteobacteria bacterium]